MIGAGVGQVSVGASRSFTMTRKVQVLVNPTPSVAFHWTVVMPLGKVAVLVGALALAIFSEMQVGRDDDATILVGITVVLAFVALWVTESLLRRGRVRR